MDGSAKMIACLACRASHLKCDGRKPVCARCEAQKLSCVYTSSLRGQRGGRRKKPRDSAVIRSTTMDIAALESTPEILDNMLFGPVGQLAQTSLPTPDPYNDMMEASVDVFYRTIHCSHPFVLPYQEYRQNRSSLPVYLKKCMAFAANPYVSMDQDIARDRALEVLDPGLPQDVSRVQGLLLLTITSYARCERQTGNEALELAINIATALGMGSESFALNAAPLQRESHRRTWWQLFIVATMISLISGLDSAIRVETSRRLPCEETAYERGSVVQCGTLEEMQARYFTDSETSWSSFAFLVEAAYILGQVLESRRNRFSGRFNSSMDSLDASLTTFALSLPPEKQRPINVNGETDELIFMAQMFTNIAGICLHLPYSRAGALDSVSTVCGNDFASQRRTDQARQPYHSARAIRSAQILTKLTIGREDVDTLTPCFSCGLAFSTSTLLGALIADDGQVTIGDTQELIKLSLAVLKRTGERWQIANVVQFHMAKHFKNVLSKQAQQHDQFNLEASIADRTITSHSDSGQYDLLDDLELGLNLGEDLDLAMEFYANVLPF